MSLSRIPADALPVFNGIRAADIRQVVLEHNFRRFAHHPLFAAVDDWVIDANPYRRPVRPQDLPLYDFTAPLDRRCLLSGSGLMAHRLLLNAYELDLVLLPDDGSQERLNDLFWFYDDDCRTAADAIRPHLERHVFGFLDDEIEVAGQWSVEAMCAFFDDRLQAEAESGEDLPARVRTCGSPRAAVRFFLVQMAGGLLTAASTITRNVPGRFGPAQCELFKILMDEYGYGVHGTRHSTLFEDALRSTGLAVEPHSYWQFYLGSSLALINYVHCVSRNHARFFRYLGALYYTEASLTAAVRRQSNLMRDVFGDDIITLCFDDHAHVDRRHGRMALDRLIKPMTAKWGSPIIPEIVRGFEALRLLTEVAAGDFAAQIEWSDNREAYKARAAALLEDPAGARARYPCTGLTGTRGELSVTHTHETDELLAVDDGELEVATSHEERAVLRADEGMVIPRFRLHGSRVLSGTCQYRVYSLPDGWGP